MFADNARTAAAALEARRKGGDDGLGARAIDAMMDGTIETKRGGAYELKREAGAYARSLQS